MRSSEITARVRLIERKVIGLKIEFQRRIEDLERSISLILDEKETGPENSREEVAPMGRNTTRDWSTARLTTV